MMVRAPGKVVLSGAYSVLEGSAALVTAVDRYVYADASRDGTRLTPELAAAGFTRAPLFDASALRSGDRKLGLGSSAAILVASLASRCLLDRPTLSHSELVSEVLARGLHAHRTAQGGGSGIDVAAACRGGTLFARRLGDRLLTRRVSLPKNLVFEIWAAPGSSSTPQLLAAVEALAAAEPARHAHLLTRQFRAAEAAAAALTRGDARGLVEALDRQTLALHELGMAAAVPIVSDAVALFRDRARHAGATVLPAGAGGGDIALYVGPAAPSPDLTRDRARHNHVVLPLSLGAPALHSLG